jgi:hypothetical protein
MQGVAMSIYAMNLVWQNYQRGGSEKLALLALADWCDDRGENLYPSVGAVAKKISSSESQARRILHGFIEEGLLEVVGNHNGGAPGQSRRYRLNLEKLAETPSVDATPCMDARPSTDARDGLHGCARRVSPMTPKPPLTINNHQESISSEKKAKGKAKRSEESLKPFLERCRAESVKPIPEDDPIFTYAEDVGLTTEMLGLCWFMFKSQYLETSKRYADWRAHFRNAVKRNWYKLWFIGADGTAGLTTAGQQAQREMAAKGRDSKE